MPTSESRLEIENRISLYENRKTEARWHIKGDQGTITLYLIPLWDEARDHSDFFEIDNPELVFNRFIEGLNWSYLMERICIERAHERIRIKGGRCKPCCIRFITEFMAEPELWDFIRGKRAHGNT